MGRLDESIERAIVDMHRDGMLNREIADFLEISVSAVEVRLRRYREATGAQSRYQAARDRVDSIGKIYTDHDGRITARAIAEIANRNTPRPDGEWTISRVQSALSQWRLRMGIESPTKERQHLWSYIHEQFSTGYTAESIAHWLNCNNLGIVGGREWTPTAVRVFHSDFAERNGIDICNQRTDDQVLEIAYRCALLRADNEYYTVADMVDLFNGEHYQFAPPDDRPWTEQMLYNLLRRSRDILELIEEHSRMASVISRTDREYRLGLALENEPSEVVIRPTDNHAFEDSLDDSLDNAKVERLHIVAHRASELRDYGYSARDIVLVLDSEHPRPTGWSIEAVRTVQAFGDAAGLYAQPERDIEDIGRRVRELSDQQELNSQEIAKRLNDELIPNPIVIGSQWSKQNVHRILRLTRRCKPPTKRTKDESERVEQLFRSDGEPTKLEQVRGVRRLRRSEILIREEARNKLAVREDAFRRASALHRQLQSIKEELALTQHEIKEADAAEALLIQTGPPILQKRLAELKESSIGYGRTHQQHAAHRELKGQADEIDKLQKRIITEDWR